MKHTDITDLALNQPCIFERVGSVMQRRYLRSQRLQQQLGDSCLSQEWGLWAQPVPGAPAPQINPAQAALSIAVLSSHPLSLDRVDPLISKNKPDKPDLHPCE